MLRTKMLMIMYIRTQFVIYCQLTVYIYRLLSISNRASYRGHLYPKHMYPCYHNN